MIVIKVLTVLTVVGLIYVLVQDMKDRRKGGKK